MVRSSVLHNDEIESPLRAVQLSILVGMIEKADEECPQILTHQFVMRITSGCPPARVSPRNACARTSQSRFPSKIRMRLVARM